MFKVSLINPPERIVEPGFRHYLPFPLMYLAAYLEERGIAADIIDVKEETGYMELIRNRLAGDYNDLYPQAIGKIINSTIAASPDLVGISCMTKEYRSVMQIASLLKAKFDLPIVAGGIHPSLYPEHFIYPGSPVDFVVIGEGEETLLELARYLEKGNGSYSDIDGIAYAKDNSCKITARRAVNYDLSASLIQTYRKLNMDFYAKPHAYVLRHVRISGIQVLTSRGCPYQCIFCSNARIQKMNKRPKPVRYRPVEKVIEEIRFVRDNYHIDGFYIMDDTFCMDRRYARDFCARLKQARINLTWGIETRADLVDEAAFKEMARVGLKQVDIGIESGSDRVLQRIKKGITVEDIIKAFSLGKRMGLRMFSSVMVNLPEETKDELRETINLLERIRPTNGVVSVASPLPKTELFDKYFAHHLKNDQEMLELLGKKEDYYRYHDGRFHFCKYDTDLSSLVDSMAGKYFLFAELQLGPWYWKLFFRSKRKAQYILSIAHGCINVLRRLPTAIIVLLRRDRL